MKGMRFAFAVALALVALGVAGCGGGDEEATPTDTGETTTTPAGTALKGSVGPGFVISITTDTGEALGTLAPGSYELEVEDLASIHNFHLTGPGGVEVETSVGEEGTESFQLELEAGTYTFVCDPHAGAMNGSFEVSG